MFEYRIAGQRPGPRGMQTPTRNQGALPCGLRRVRFRKGRLGMDITPRLWVRSVAPNSQAEERGVEPYSCVACINNRSFANLNDLQNFVLHSVPDGESGA